MSAWPGNVTHRDPHQHFFATGVGGKHFDLHLVARTSQLFKSEPYSLFNAEGLDFNLSQNYSLP
jgi:hypothetical protein